MSAAGGDGRRSIVKVGDVAVEVHEFGQGRPLLYLHGGHGLLYDMPFLRLLARNRRVIAACHLGFERSELPDWADSVDDLAHAHIALLRQMGVQKFDCVGHSLGGWVAAEVATKQPDAIERLALIAPVGVKTGPEDRLDVPDIFAMHPDKAESLLFVDPKSAKPDFASMSDEELGIIARNRESHALFVWEPYMHNPKLKHRLHVLEMPTLFIRGAQDGFVSDGYLRSYAELVKGARIQTVAGAAHLPQFEKPTETLASLETFLTP